MLFTTSFFKITNWVAHTSAKLLSDFLELSTILRFLNAVVLVVEIMRFLTTNNIQKIIMQANRNH